MNGLEQRAIGKILGRSVGIVQFWTNRQSDLIYTLD